MFKNRPKNRKLGQKNLYLLSYWTTDTSFIELMISQVKASVRANNRREDVHLVSIKLVFFAVKPL